MFFGASFSRYGFDFRPLFIQFFTRKSLNNFRQSLVEANLLFQQLIQSYTFDQSASVSASDSSTNAFSPPMVLVHYTPLAVYCNSLLTAFNDLRLCCPISNVVTIKQLLTDSLIFVRDHLCNYYQSERLTLTVSEFQHFLEFLRIVVNIFNPYIGSCLQALFPDEQLARTLGVSILDITEKSKLNRIDLDQISQPIQKIIDAMAPKRTDSSDERSTTIKSVTTETDKNQVETHD